MAQRTVVQLVDDLDGSELNENEGETVRFALDGVEYETDLGRKNAQSLRDAFGQYIDHARKTGGSRTRKAGKPLGSKSDYDAKAVRAWAESNKVDVPARGRIPASVVVQFKEAGN